MNWKRVGQLAERRGVDHQAVVNFFINMGKKTLDEALAEMQTQREWNHETVAAVQTGILEHFATEEQ